MTMLTPWQGAIDAAVAMARCSPCQSKRGATIFNAERVYASGYNFKPRGFDCDGSDTCKATCRVEAVHAEEMAMLMVPGRPLPVGSDMLHVKVVDGELVPTGPPSCVRCSVKILAFGIWYMWLFEAAGWRCYRAAEFHRLSIANQRV